MIDLDDLIGGGKPELVQQQPLAPENTLNALSEIFSSNVTINPQAPINQNIMNMYPPQNLSNPNPINQQKTIDLMESGDLLGGGGGDSSINNNFKAFEDQNLELIFVCTKVFNYLF